MQKDIMERPGSSNQRFGTDEIDNGVMQQGIMERAGDQQFATHTEQGIFDFRKPYCPLSTRSGDMLP